MDQNNLVIHAKDLSKRYPGASTYALRDLNLNIQSGEVYGFLGPNGAGKSTTIRLLMNFIQPTKGSATILGLDSVKESTQIKKSVGYLSGSVALYRKMTGKQFLDYMSELQLPKRATLATELAKRFDANLNKRIGDLSKGNYQKIGIIQAFMHEPDVLILDEPTSGLDPLMQEQFFEIVKEAKQRGAALFVSSHNLMEVQKMCDRVGFIKDGKLISEQTLADMAKEATQTFDISFVKDVPLTELKAIPKAKVTKNSAHYVTVHMHGNLSELFKVLAKHQVHSINQREANLEQEFLKFYEEAKK